ncbi:hypothetical protein BV25DRAFT_1472011 [Artomyces pyxidatus]|uniref:Uncharacterized protein n=1 Tax=Artomyces pyxidatus TaxID=48021 RepID=A0ACB8SKK0_9AGAM|nr:hypothetical protein BV25DRAFT_1472011 [Artomyces pyxidatus]
MRKANRVLASPLATAGMALGRWRPRGRNHSQGITRSGSLRISGASRTWRPPPPAPRPPPRHATSQLSDTFAPCATRSVPSTATALLLLHPHSQSPTYRSVFTRDRHACN